MQLELQTYSECAAVRDALRQYAQIWRKHAGTEYAYAMKYDDAWNSISMALRQLNYAMEAERLIERIEY